VLLAPHTGGFERVRAQVPVGYLANFTHPQPRGNGHALRADVAADGNQRGQAVAATCLAPQIPKLAKATSGSGLKLIHGQYLIYYRIQEQEKIVEIIAFKHAAQIK
jgi:plasmid stabilization system protein ParE